MILPANLISGMETIDNKQLAFPGNAPVAATFSCRAAIKSELKG
jgi:hypothetical protein